VHKFSIVAATLPPAGGQPEDEQNETTDAAVRRFIERPGGPDGLAACYAEGLAGVALLQSLSELGVAQRGRAVVVDPSPRWGSRQDRSPWSRLLRAALRG
jgi:hypothetical protein